MTRLMRSGRTAPKWVYLVLSGAVALSLSGCANGSEQSPTSSRQPTASTTPENFSLTKQPAEMTPAEFTALPFMNKLDYAGPVLNTNTARTTDRLNAALSDLGYGTYNYFNRPVVPPSLYNNTQEIWDQFTLASFQVWERSRQGTIGVDDALKWSEVVAEGKKYEDLTETFRTEVPAIPLAVSCEETKVQLPKSGDWARFDSAISFTKQEIIVDDPSKPEYTKVTMGFKKGNLDNSGRWILLDASRAPMPS